MRVFLGMILGAMLTIAIAFIHDTTVTSSVAASSTASDRETVVNWGVLKSNVRGIVANLRTIDSRAREGWTKLTHEKI